MEQTIVNAFIESIQTILKDSVAKMTEEARKFTLVVTTMGRFASSTTASTTHIPVASPIPSASLDQRVHVLETTILDRTQKMLHGVMEDISELHSRVDKIQNPTREWDNDNEEFPIPWFDRQPFTFPTPRNEIVHETPVENIRTLHVNPSVLHPPEPVEEPDGPPEEADEPEPVKVEEKKASEPEPVKVEEKKASEPEQEDVEEEAEVEAEEKKAVEPEEAAEEEEEEAAEEGEEEELEDFQHQGKLYYRDKDNNVYVEDEEGGIDGTPVGRWIQAKNTIKFFPK